MSIPFSLSMYYLSFIPLWITVLFIDIKSMTSSEGDKYTEVISIIGILVGSIIALVIVYVKFLVIEDEKYTLRLHKAKECKTITTEFLLSYILPLFAFDFTQWDEVVQFFIFFVILGYLCIRHNYFCVNIILELMHYRMFECILINADDIMIERVVISKNTLTIKKGKDVQVKILNNEYYLELHDQKKSISETWK